MAKTTFDMIGRSFIEMIQTNIGETGENETPLQALERIVRERDELAGQIELASPKKRTTK